MERQPHRRRRPALSCLECRRRKIKCDRNDPCAHCVVSKISCTYRAHGHEPIRQQNILQTTTPSASADDISATSQGQHDCAEQASGANHTHIHQSTDQPPEGEPHLWNLLQRGGRPGETSASSPIQGLSETGRQILARQSGLQESQVVLNKTRILGWSHWMVSAPEYKTIIACYSEACGHSKDSAFQDRETAAAVAEMGILLRKCKGLAKGIKVGRPSRSLPGPESSLVLPLREVADTMANLYFASFESTHRILHVPTFWTQYQTYWNGPETTPTKLRLIVLLVVAIGSSLHRGEDAGLRDMAHQWVYIAQTWLSGPLEKDRLDISGLQIHCLTILARQAFSIGGDLVWMSMGSLIHRAMQIGLHRDPKHLPPMSILQAEVRRRLWATILEMIVQSSLDSAMPPRISYDEFDTEAPSNYNDEELNDSSTPAKPHTQDTHTEASFQIILLKSLPTRLQALQLLNGLRSELSYVDVLALSPKISDACREAMSACRGWSAVKPFHKNMLDYLVRRFLIPLHYPFASQARANPLFYYSLKVSLDTAMALLTPEIDESFSRLMAVGGGSFREGMRYASSVICLELLAQTEAQRLEGTLQRDPLSREPLKKIMMDLLRLSEERIRQGETNIKSHMTLNMIMAQVEAMEANVPCELRMVQSAVKSLQFCYELLRKRTDGGSMASFGNSRLASMTPDFRLEGYGLDFDFDLDMFLPDAVFS